MSSLKLIVGLGNPGPQFQSTRHNVGADWVRSIAADCNIPLALETKFKGHIGRGVVAGVDLRLMVPTTYMNNSGEAVGALAQFFKWQPEEILVVHDEVAFAPGICRLKNGGGDNGHNGLKSVRAYLANSDAFNRLRIGVGHPGSKALVNAYLTQQKPPLAEREATISGSHFAPDLLQDIVTGAWESAMTKLHSQQSEAAANESKNSAAQPSGASDAGK